MGLFFALLTGVLVGILIGVMVARATVRRVRAGRHPSIGESITGPIPRPADVDRESDAELARALRGAVDRLQIGVVTCDSDARFTYRNTAADKLSGTHQGIVVDTKLREVFAETATQESAERTVELQGPPKVVYSIEAMRLGDGGAVATIVDVSEQSRIDAMRTDFVANISHELKTPVGAIAVLAEMLADERDADVIATLSNRVVDESHRAALTIDALLELSRIEASERVESPVELASVIGEAVARGKMVAEGCDVRVEAMELPDALWLRADQRQLASAIGNLVENAVKYSDGGGVVQVRARVTESSVEVMIADQGVGIPARDLARVFERFYRVDKARARGTGGTGLGLAIVRHVASNHGGDVSVESQEGEGSTFVLRLPAGLIVEAPAASSGVSASGEMNSASGTSSDDDRVRDETDRSVSEHASEERP